MDEGAGPNFKVVERLDVEDEETRQARIRAFKLLSCLSVADRSSLHRIVS